MKLNDLLLDSSSWELLRNSNEPIVLYGTGNGADRVLDEFLRLGITIEAVTASDGFVRDRHFRGYKVESLTAVSERLLNFTVALGFATSIPGVIDNIKSIAEKHRLIVPVVPVFGDEIFDRKYIENNIDALTMSRELLCDDESKRVFDGMVRFQFTGKLRYLFEIESSRKDALKDILALGKNEDMLDLGAYRGDTIRELLDISGGFGSVIALEPDSRSFEKLTDYSKQFKNIKALPFAAWDRDESLTFSGGGGRQSSINSMGKTEVSAVSIDSLLKSSDRRISYVKMDVEGAEEKALCGMKILLKNQKPKLSIAAYHRTSDLLRLIPLINKLNPDYRIYLRHHPYIPCWDTNLYCI